MKFLIIGGDAAGMSAASRAKRNDPDLDIWVLEKTMDVSYSACGMPYNIADPNRKMDDLVVRHAKVFREKQGIHLLTGHLAESIDPDNRSVFGIAVVCYFSGIVGDLVVLSSIPCSRRRMATVQR